MLFLTLIAMTGSATFSAMTVMKDQKIKALSSWRAVAKDLRYNDLFWVMIVFICFILNRFMV